ncbi:MAG TPA: prephenate dehydrogenase/arogenate dehydrogenase family protein [Candidatus Omnitrophica bacterium]|nr:prephenate dehydrogenase/arogenate dehydrogenase family protein [Candidatus Omnitrophota bacterium]
MFGEMLRNSVFRKVTIIGVGFMGGSLGLALKKHGLAGEVAGVSHRQVTLDKAIELKAIDAGFTDLQKGVFNADLVVLAAPVQVILQQFSLINPHLKRGCLVTDMGSVKADIVERAESALSAPGMFVGSHPLAGSEKKGVEYANADLFANARCIMTPTARTTPVAKEKIKFLWTRLGCHVEFLSPEDHDKVLARVSHLPHLLAYALIGSVAKEYLPHAPQGLKDSTRIAASPPQVWNDIFLTNPKNVLDALDALVKDLAFLRKVIIQRDQKGLLQYLEKAKEKRDSLG